MTAEIKENIINEQKMLYQKIQDIFLKYPELKNSLKDNTSLFPIILETFYSNKKPMLPLKIHWPFVLTFS